jgi:chromosome segregation ATPase
MRQYCQTRMFAKGHVCAGAASRYVYMVSQVEFVARSERERLEARATELSTARQRLEQSLADVQEECTRAAREAGQQRQAADNARARCDALQAQLDDAITAARQHQAALVQSNAKDREAISDLVTRLEHLTRERDDAQKAAAASETRLRVCVCVCANDHNHTELTHCKRVLYVPVVIRLQQQDSINP